MTKRGSDPSRIQAGPGADLDPTLIVAAPAKVNLFLHVTGRRADGWHTLESLFALIDLADTLTISRRDDGAIVRMRGLPGVPEDTDLALRAARALREATGTRFGAAIAVEKRIPRGGGLGGGSSDAASVLLALNRLWSTALPRTELARLALTLGADVPFFLGGVPAFARGVGEILSPVSLPTLWLALAIPPVAVETSVMFAAPELTRTSPSAKMEIFSEGYGRNDLASVAVARYPAVADALAALLRASPLARMTGSGACVIAPFADERAARAAVDVLPAGIAGLVVRTIDRHPLAGFA